MKTLTDYLDRARPSRTKKLDESKDGYIEIDSSSSDAIFLLKEALPLSIIFMRPIALKNFDFINERISAVLECAKRISNAKTYCENNTFHFQPRKLSFNEKEFSYDGGVVSEMISVVLPVMIFSQKNSIVTFEGITEHQKSIDYFTSSVVPFLVPFCEIDVKVLERGFMFGKKGRVQLSLKPRFKFNKSIYDEILTDKSETISGFLVKVKERLKKAISSKGTLKPLSVRCIISAPKSSMEIIENDLKRPIDLELRNSRFPANIKVEYSDIDASNASITLYSLFSRNDEIDFSTAGTFDILSKSIVINNLEKRNITKLLMEITGFCRDVVSRKSRYEDLDRELMIYDFLFGLKSGSQKNAVFDRFI